MAIPCCLRPFRCFIGWRMQFIRLEYSTCIRNCQVETDALSGFNRAAMPTHDPFDIRFGRSNSTVRLCRHTIRFCHQVRTVQLNHRAMPTHDPLEIRFGLPSSTMQLKGLVYQSFHCSIVFHITACLLATLYFSRGRKTDKKTTTNDNTSRLQMTKRTCGAIAALGDGADGTVNHRTSEGFRAVSTSK